MGVKSKLLLFIQNDNSVYQLLLTGLLLASPSLHYLCFYNSYDPLWLRLLASALCLIALLLSSQNNVKVAAVGRYTAIGSFIAINNGLLLSQNGFSHVYLFSALTVFVGLTLFCKKLWEFAALWAFNTITIVIAYFAAPRLHTSIGILALLIVTFAFIASVSFLVTTAHKMRFKRAMVNVIDLNKSLIMNDEEMRDSSRKMDALINSLNDVIFEFDEDKVCRNTWFRRIEGRVIDPEICIDKRLEEVLGEEKAKKFNVALDHVIQTLEPVSITYQSDFGTGQWLIAKFAPVFDRTGKYTSRLSASLSDISEQVKYADALKENEELLTEAQTIAKMGNWYFDIITRETYLSPSLLHILGVDILPAGMDKFEFYMSLVHPDDRGCAYNYFTNVQGLDKAEFEHKIITSEGELKYIKVLKGQLLKDADGNTKRVTGIIQDITETRLSEKKIKVSQTELVEAQTIAKIGNWKWDIALKRLTWSDEISNIFEIDTTAVQENNIVKLLLKHAHPADRVMLKQRLKEISTTTHTSYSYRIVMPGGNVKHISVIVGKLLKRDDGTIRKVIGTVQDITERKLAEIEYRRTENKYKLVLETIKLPAISVDSGGSLIFCNKHMTALLGYDQNEILGLNWLEKFVPEDQRGEMYNSFTHNPGDAQFTGTVICRNGEQRVISWQHTVTYDDNGMIKEITGIGEDITDRQKATEALISAKEQAEKSSHFKSEFLSIMSHEIRTPMNAVIGTTNLLLSESPLPEQLEYLNILKFSGENLLAIINDILDYNKIEAGKLELNILPLDVFGLAQKIKQSFHPKATEKELGIELHVDPSIPEYILGDQVRLGQVLNNLLSNAIKFTDEGKVSLQLEKENVSGKQVTIRFTVSDTGIGIAPENLALIFDPFMQESQKHENDYGGTGLGLAITKRLIDLHGSNISVMSDPGRGTAFTFSITFDIAAKVQTDLQLPETTIATAERNLQGMRILVVDDNKMNLMIASKFLKKWQVEADEAISGVLAIEMVNKKQYDLIIMDLQMPEMDGFQTTKNIRQTHPDIPVIALTADAMPETHAKALAAGMQSYLTKPFVPDTLYEKISGYYVLVE